MIAFEVYLNGKKLCTAGVNEPGVLTTCVTWAGRAAREEKLSLKERLWLDVGGLDSATQERITWRARSLRVSDEISIRIIETSEASKPRERSQRDPAQELRWKKAYVRQAAKELGWKLQKGPR